MSKIAERIKERTSRLQSIEVLEWGEEGVPEKVFFGPLLTKELHNIQRKHPNFTTNASFEGMVDLIIAKAKNADGEKMFDLGDKPVLMREEVRVISEVAGAMLSGTNAEEFEKN